jgi:uncharacterized protein
MAQITSESVESTLTPAEVAPAVANPAPLGLSAFALTTFVLSSNNAGLFSAPEIVLGLALFYGGIVQILAGLQEFRTGNTFGATAFCSYGAFWLAFAVILIPGFNVIAAYKAGGDVDTALAFFLLGWTIFTGLMLLGSLRTHMSLILVFLLLFVTFLALTVGKFLPSAEWTQAGGWLGIATAVAAWYAALANLLASSKSIFKLPL